MEELKPNYYRRKEQAVENVLADKGLTSDNSISLKNKSQDLNETSCLHSHEP